MRFGGCLLLALWLGTSLAGCAPTSEPAPVDLQSLCGPTSKLQDVERYDGSFGVSTAFVARHRRAVGLLRWKSDLVARYREEAGDVEGSGWCTGTLIDHDLFLTAGHCLDNNEDGSWRLPHEKGGIKLSPAELAREFVVEFRNETSADTAKPAVVDTVEVVRLEEHRAGGVDYAILRLSGDPGLRNGVTRISPIDARPGSLIAILQHPAQMPMKIGAGSAARVESSKIWYDAIDTLGGSSGAGILDVATGKLVGIHTDGGCMKDGGGENHGVTVGALTAVSPTIRDLVDRSKDFLVGDWDNDGRSDLAVFYDGCLYPDANHDGEPDQELKQCPLNRAADTYFVGRWQAGHPTGLGWRRGGCVYLDINPERPLCFGADRTRFEILVADWNDDGRSDLGVQHENCIDFDTDLDGVPDAPGYCYGNGLGEDEYLAGRWNGGPSDSIAVRRGNTILVDSDRDGNPDPDQTRTYGMGGNEAQYLVGDWNGDQRDKLAVRRRNICLMNHDSEDGIAEEGRVYRDFWSEQ